MKKEIINRLEYVEETYAGELETWHDPVTDTHYHVPIEITRRWDESEALMRDIQNFNTMTHERKKAHIRNLPFCINDGTSGYVTDNLRFEDSPVPRRKATMKPLHKYANQQSRTNFAPFLRHKP